MSQYNNINEFNVDLSNNQVRIKLNEYFKEIRNKFYSNLDISFMDYFLDLTKNEGEFIVEHQKLQDYGVLTNINTSKDIKKGLDRLFLVENEDYKVGHVSQVRTKSTGENTGNVIKNEYKLTPYAFKLCLIRSKNSKKYAKYYLLLEQVFKNYQDYQIMYQKVLLSGKDDKIDEQSKKIDNLIKETKNLTDENKKQSAQIEELLGYAKKTTEQNEELKETVEDMNEEIKDMNEEIKEMNEDINDMSKDINNLNDTMDEIKESFKETADRSVPNPKEEVERHEFILLQSKENNNKFTFLRGIKELNENKIHSKYADYNVIKREFNANPVQLFRQFRDTMKERYEVEKNKIKNSKVKNKVELKKQAQKVKISSIKLELMNGYTLNELLDDLTEVCNEKFKDYSRYSDNP